MGKRAKYKPYAIESGGIEYRLNWFDGQFAVVWWEDGQRRRVRLGVTTEEEGRFALIAHVRKREKLSAKTAETVGELFDAYIADRRVEGKNIQKMQWVWSALKPAFAGLRPDEIDKQLCKDYASERGKLGRSAWTVWTELTLLRTLLNWAVKERLIEARPRLWTPPDPPPRDRHLTREEFLRLLEAAVYPHVRLFCILAIGTLARKEAILDLTWQRCDFERRLIYLHDPEKPQTNKGRAIVPMTDSVFAALMEAREGALTDYVIEWDGERVGSIKRSLGRALKAAGIKQRGDGAHLLRHSGAVWAVEAGVPMEEISQYLGHRRIETTRRIYARFSPDYLRRAASALEVAPQGPRRALHR